MLSATKTKFGKNLVKYVTRALRIVSHDVYIRAVGLKVLTTELYSIVKLRVDLDKIWIKMNFISLKPQSAIHQNWLGTKLVT